MREGGRDELVADLCMCHTFPYTGPTSAIRVVCGYCFVTESEKDYIALSLPYFHPWKLTNIFSPRAYGPAISMSRGLRRPSVCLCLPSELGHTGLLFFEESGGAGLDVV
jgi:hypothetical protein